jgi:hypothetical protein
MKNENAVALGRRGSKAKNAKLTEQQRKEMMAEVRKGKGVHPKNQTLRTPCPLPGCRVTVSHQHL